MRLAAFLWLAVGVTPGPLDGPADDLIIDSIAGTGQPGFSGDGGPAAMAILNGPFDLTFDSQGNIVFSDTMNHAVRRIDAKTGIIQTIAGNGRPGFSGDGGSALHAQLHEPYGVVFDAQDHLYIADRINRRVRKVDTRTGTIRSYAGDGGKAFAGDGGPAESATLVEPNGLAVDPVRKRLYIADVSDNRIRVVDLESQRISTFAGNGQSSRSAERVKAVDAPIQGARAIRVGKDGTVYLVERQGNRIRAIDPGSGIVETIAGTGSKGFSLGPQPADQASFNGPKELAIDPNGDLLIVDTENHAIRKVELAAGLVSTVIGDGRAGGNGDGGPPSKARLNRPHGVLAGHDGTIYIGDTENHRIRRIRIKRSLATGKP